MNTLAFLPNDAQIRRIGAARNAPSIERSRYPIVRLRRKELDAGSIEFATCLEATRLLNARGFPRHVLEHTTKVVHHLRPSDSVDSQPFENRWRFDWCGASFACKWFASQPIEDL